MWLIIARFLLLAVMTDASSLPPCDVSSPIFLSQWCVILGDFSPNTTVTLQPGARVQVTGHLDLSKGLLVSRGDRMFESFGTLNASSANIESMIVRIQILSEWSTMQSMDLDLISALRISGTLAGIPQIDASRSPSCLELTARAIYEPTTLFIAVHADDSSCNSGGNRAFPIILGIAAFCALVFAIYQIIQCCNRRKAQQRAPGPFYDEDFQD